MQLLPNVNKVQRFLIIFYLIGTLGFMLPLTRSFFIQLIPLALLLNVFLLVYFHKPNSLQNYAVMILIAFLGFAIEVVGVKTGLLFGEYSYGTALGPKLMGVPLLIGINWFFLTYAASVVVGKMFRNTWSQMLSASSMVVIYDFVMEPVAVSTGMWYWQSGIIPVQNYLMWFITAAFFVFLFSKFVKNSRNPMALPILVLQFLFFSVLHLFITFF
ncbi:MAG: carotenoid biosynthesis protein [Salinivirgaceae bacterium]